MEKVAVLIVVRGGVAYEYAPDFADVRIVDLDNVHDADNEDGAAELPDTHAWRELARRAGLEHKGERPDVRFALNAYVAEVHYRTARGRLGMRTLHIKAAQMSQATEAARARVLRDKRITRIDRVRVTLAKG